MKISSNKILDKDLGNEIKLKGGEVISKTEVLCKKGTSISVQNLFFNIPARRNFLKSDNVELRHIIDEFHRVSLINNSINFIFINNETSYLVYQFLTFDKESLIFLVLNRMKS